jgi:XTP/dITP diphosphohydrolase
MSILQTSTNLLGSALLLASSNTSKLVEIKSIFQKVGLSQVFLRSLSEFSTTEPEEPYNSFIENAVHKAKHYARQTNVTCLAEDSGLCIKALAEMPGVRSKDFIQESGGIDRAISRLKTQLEKKPKDRPFSASIRSAVAIYDPLTDKLLYNEAIDMGVLSFPPRGNLGFGFDPIFIPQGQLLTFAELGTENKNRISQRTEIIESLLKSFFNRQD